MEELERVNEVEEVEGENTNRITCHHCEKFFDEVDVHYLDNYDYYVCDNCYNDEYRSCEDCGDAILLNEDEYIINANGDYICSNCSDNYYLCERCEEYCHKDDMYYHEGRESYYCDECYVECCKDEDLDNEDSI